MSMASPQPLNYSQRPQSFLRRRLFRRVSIIAGVVLLSLILRAFWTGYLRDRVAWVRAWHRAESFTEPPTTPIFTDDPVLGRRLLASGYAGHWTEDFKQAQAFECPTTWSDFPPFPASLWINGCVFLHSRAAHGRSRIVEVWMESELDFERFSIQSQTVSWLWNPPQRLPRPTPSTHLTVIAKPTEPFTVFAGQPDPTDDSHFTIRYDLAGKPGTIDGYLLDDGTVKLSVRDGPLLGRPPH